MHYGTLCCLIQCGAVRCTAQCFAVVAKCACVSLYTCIYAKRVCVSLYICIYANVHICFMHIYIQIYVYICMYIFVCTYICVFMYIHICVYVHKYIHIYLYTSCVIQKPKIYLYLFFTYISYHQKTNSPTLEPAHQNFSKSVPTPTPTPINVHSMTLCTWTSALATHCNALQHSATSATHCKNLQRTLDHARGHRPWQRSIVWPFDSCRSRLPSAMGSIGPVHTYIYTGICVCMYI